METRNSNGDVLYLNRSVPQDHAGLCKCVLFVNDNETFGHWFLSSFSNGTARWLPQPAVLPARQRISISG